MAANGPNKTTSPLSIIAILTVLGGAYYAYQSQLKSSRPEGPGGLTQSVLEKNKIKARLWQDPLKVALDHERAMHFENKDEDKSYDLRSLAEHSLGQIHARIAPMPQQSLDVNTTVHILLTMVRDGISAEDHERRLRNRYAMLTALHSSGLVPEDSMHIRYFRLPWIERNELEEKIVRYGYNHIPKIGEDCNCSSEQLIVPYEWFEKEELYLSRISGPDEDPRPENVLLVWLAESAFSHRPLTRLAQVIDAFSPADSNRVRIDMIGPSDSENLRTMLSEVEEIYYSNNNANNSNFVDVNRMLEELTIFSPWSTVSPALLVKEWSCHDANHNSISEMYEVIPDEFMKVGVKFLRMIGSDDLLSLELINELKRRGVDVLPADEGGKGHHVALILEWDTFYGNAFPMTFATMMGSIDPHTDLPYNWNSYISDLNLIMMRYVGYFPENLHTYIYIRGVDGRLPGSKSSKEKKMNDDAESGIRWTYTENLELPIGRGQLDYIGRVTQELSHKYKRLGDNKLKAIGVVGSDVYDKLFLLSVLREQLGDIILFTVDLDARMLHDEQLKWTRNVIVASHFGLELNSKYMDKDTELNIPAFRDTYQTSLFLACRTALTPRADDPNNKKPFRDMEPDDLTRLFAHPRLFEIGRGRAVDLSMDDVDIHPPRYGKELNLALLWALPALIVLIPLAMSSFILLLIQVSPYLNEILSMIRLKGSFAAKLLIVCVIVFVAIVCIDHYRPGGEPFSLVSGVSIWPGAALRLISIILSAFFFIKSVRDLRANEEHICLLFDLHMHVEPPREGSFTKWIHNKFVYKRWRHLPMFWLRRRKSISLDDWRTDKPPSIDVQKLWTGYLIRGTLTNRLHRVLPMSFSFGLLCVTLMFIFGLPNRPCRGSISWFVDSLLFILSASFMIILMCFVVDATYSCLKLVRNLIKGIWPAKLLSNFKDKEDKTTKVIGDWLSVKFIASCTEAVGKLVYYPFIILVIMFVARTRYFDNWDFPNSLIIIVILYLVYIISCALVLRHLAEHVRSLALKGLQTELGKVAGISSEQSRIDKLERMIEEIKYIREGAFRSFTEHPVIRVIFGSGGAGLLALLKNILFS